jgi:hypothetical protein
MVIRKISFNIADTCFSCAHFRTDCFAVAIFFLFTLDNLPIKTLQKRLKHHLGKTQYNLKKPLGKPD